MITLAQLSEIESGCEGVTPGPWRGGHRCDGWLTAPNPDIPTKRCGIGEIYARIDASHIARLDPATVRELVRLARIGLASESKSVPSFDAWRVPGHRLVRRRNQT